MGITRVRPISGCTKRHGMYTVQEDKYEPDYEKTAKDETECKCKKKIYEMSLNGDGVRA